MKSEQAQKYKSFKNIFIGLRAAQIASTGISALLGIILFFAAYTNYQASENAYRELWWLLLLLGPVCGYYIYQKATHKYRGQIQTIHDTFPPAWRQHLNEWVEYYQGLSAEKQEVFEQRVMLFLQSKNIVGAGIEVDDATRMLVAASAVIPTMGFPDWEYDTLGTILIYPDLFTYDYKPARRGTEQLAGLVGSQYHYNTMILSLPYLWQGFTDKTSGRNVGVHEFAHLIDAADGSMDGIAALYLDKPALRQWPSLLQSTTEAILRGESLIDEYAATNPQEFFAVLSEYFFELPELLLHEYPLIYQIMCRAYRQNPHLVLQQPHRKQAYEHLKSLHAERLWNAEYMPLFVNYILK